MAWFMGMQGACKLETVYETEVSTQFSEQKMYLFFNKRLASQFIIQDTMFLIIVYFFKSEYIC